MLWSHFLSLGENYAFKYDFNQCCQLSDFAVRFGKILDLFSDQVTNLVTFVADVSDGPALDTTLQPTSQWLLYKLTRGRFGRLMTSV